MTWRSLAACRGVDPDLFFPTKGESTREARATCRGCPVQIDCIADHVTEETGIWGGLGRHDRAVLRGRLAARGVVLNPGPEHGTRARYARGCRCDACRAANTAYSVARRGTRRAAV